MGLTTCRTSFYSRIPSFPVPKRRPLLRRRDDDDDSSPPPPANRTRIRSASNRPAQSSLFQSKQRVRGRRVRPGPHFLPRTSPWTRSDDTFPSSTRPRRSASRCASDDPPRILHIHRATSSPSPSSLRSRRRPASTSVATTASQINAAAVAGERRSDPIFIIVVL